MAKEKIYSVIELPLITETWQKDILEKKMECVRKIYNTMLSVQLKKYHEMIKTKEWRELNAIIREEFQRLDNSEKESAKKKKSAKLNAAYERKNAIMREYGFTEFDFVSLAIQYSKYYQKHVSSIMASMGIGKVMWAAFEKLFFGNGEKVSFKKLGAVSSLVSDNRSGIRFLKEDNGSYYIFFSNRVAKAKPVKLYVKGPNTIYDNIMLDSNIKVVRVVRKIEKGHKKYYCQLTVDRAPFIKLDNDGNLKHPTGKGVVGICIWRNMLCAVSQDKKLCVNLCPDAEEYSIKKAELSRELEHLRRVNNPSNYEEDGQIKKGIIGEDGKRHRLQWQESNHYKKVKAQLRELYRKHDVQKKLLQNRLVLELLAMGDEFHFADTSFLTMKPEWDEEEPLSNSEYKKKKARRRSIQEGAPSSLLMKLDAKLAARGMLPIQKYEIPEGLYWYHHEKGVSDKELFAGEKILVEDRVVDQTMYRAFLIRHFNNNAKVYEQTKLLEEWNNFIISEE